MTADYTVQTKQKFKRIGLASFLCGIAACVTVALIGAGLAFTYLFLSERLGIFPMIQDGILLGIGYGLIACALNWFFGYVTIPVTMLILFFTIGRMPKRGITYRRPFLKWTTILGAGLVSAVTSIGVPLFTSLNSGVAQNTSTMEIIIGAGLAGAAVGALAGLIIGWLFYAIVRPAEQVRTIDASVF
jgi:hypothetical protein